MVSEDDGNQSCEEEHYHVSRDFKYNSVVGVAHTIILSDFVCMRDYFPRKCDICVRFVLTCQ